MTRSSREPRRMWVAPGRRAARRSRLRVACNCFTIYSETHHKTKRKQNVQRFLEWRVSACVSRVAALGFCTFMHHGVLSRTQTKNVRLSFLRRKVAKAQDDTADAAFYLGASLYGEGKYRESAAAYEKSSKVRPNDVVVLSNWGLSLTLSGRYAQAEPLLR